MKSKEAILLEQLVDAANETFGYTAGMDIYLDFDDFEIIRDALSKRIEYGWHKYPDDEPPHGYVETCAYWHENYQNVRAFYDSTTKSFLFHPDNNAGKQWVKGLNAIAWKEIEQYKKKGE